MPEEQENIEYLAVKAIGDWELEVLGIPFGGPDGGKDADGEFFTPKTDILLKIGDKRPVFYNHGADPSNRKEIFPTVIGEATYVRWDAKGHWFRVSLDKTSEYAARIMESAKAGLARASSGAVNYLTRIVRKTGEVLVWALAELTLIDAEPGKREPANDYAVAYLKTAYEHANLQLPEAFVEDGQPSKTKATDKGNGGKGQLRANPVYLYEIQSRRKG
jgi:hypothetical protein